MDENPSMMITSTTKSIQLVAFFIYECSVSLVGPWLVPHQPPTKKEQDGKTPLDPANEEKEYDAGATEPDPPPELPDPQYQPEPTVWAPSLLDETA
uniref:Uncharacterized protein n=1 Tax=Sphaerodactylus townsendi TaxID=933632 RepID=A0ACB8F9N1_9SAUR